MMFWREIFRFLLRETFPTQAHISNKQKVLELGRTAAAARERERERERESAKNNKNKNSTNKKIKKNKKKKQSTVVSFVFISRFFYFGVPMRCPTPSSHLPPTISILDIAATNRIERIFVRTG